MKVLRFDHLRWRSLLLLRPGLLLQKSYTLVHLFQTWMHFWVCWLKMDPVLDFFFVVNVTSWNKYKSIWELDIAIDSSDLFSDSFTDVLWCCFACENKGNYSMIRILLDWSILNIARDSSKKENHYTMLMFLSNRNISWQHVNFACYLLGLSSTGELIMQGIWGLSRLWPSNCLSIDCEMTLCILNEALNLYVDSCWSLMLKLLFTSQLVHDYIIFFLSQ